MVQKVGAQFALKKISEYVMAPPPSAEEEVAEEAPQASAPAASASAGPLDGQMITDENGDRLGIARHVANIAVYVIADGRSGLDKQLEAAITDPEGRVFFQHADNGRLTGLIYVPDPSRRPASVAVTRADDI